jgi:hypothetical protein
MVGYDNQLAKADWLAKCRAEANLPREMQAIVGKAPPHRAA